MGILNKEEEEEGGLLKICCGDGGWDIAAARGSRAASEICILSIKVIVSWRQAEDVVDFGGK